MRRVLSFILVLLLLAFDFAQAEHHHEDHELHLDCTLCIIQHTQQEDKAYKPELKINLFSLFVSFELPEPPKPSTRKPEKQSIRAPPA